MEWIAIQWTKLTDQMVNNHILGGSLQSEDYLQIGSPHYWPIILNHQANSRRPLFFYREKKFLLHLYQVMGWQWSVVEKKGTNLQIKMMIHLQDEQKEALREMWNFHLDIDSFGRIIGGKWLEEPEGADWIQMDSDMASDYRKLWPEVTPCRALKRNLLIEKVFNRLEDHYKTDVTKLFTLLRVHGGDEHLFHHQRVKNRLTNKAYKRWSQYWSTWNFLQHLFFCGDAVFRNQMIEEFFHHHIDVLSVRDKQSLIKSLYPLRIPSFYAGQEVKKRLESF